MTLPGKLTIGFLQEDNPQKFYFRVRPVLIWEETDCQIIENARQDYLEDGFIRIVPDKNELSHFKTRMRGLGRYCAIDLRRHPGENDKIRPNKNHNGENGDRNAFIVYSDVIDALEPLRMAEVAEINEDGLFARPGTRLVAARREGAFQGVYLWAEREGGAACIVGESLCPAEALKDEMIVTLAAEDASIAVVLNLDRLGVELTEAQLQAVPLPEGVETSARFTPEAPAKTAEPGEGASQAVQAAAEPTRPEKTDKAARPAEKPEKEAVRQEKPWLQQSPTYVFPRAVAGKGGSSKGQGQQCGYNPARGLTIKDIVDDQWRQSRFDQLGHPVVSDTTTAPVVSPVDQAMNALRDVWSLPEARASLVSALLKLDKLDEALGAAGAPDAAETRAVRHGEEQMQRLEAERLKLLGEIDELKRFRQDKRVELLEELRRTHNAEFDKSSKRNEQLLSEQKEYQKKAAEARDASAQAEKALKTILGEKLDERLAEKLLDGRAIELMAALSRREIEQSVRVPVEKPSAGELISQVRVRFEEAGISLTNDEAVNLMACVALGRVLVVSGPCGSARAEYARALAAALGLGGDHSDCFCEVQAQAEWQSLGREIETLTPSGVADVRLPRVMNVLKNDEMTTPTMLLIGNANRGMIERYLGELLTLGEMGAPEALRTGAGTVKLSGSLRLVLTVQDDAEPLTGELLERAWLMRLAPEAADSPWPPKAGRLPRPEKAVSLESLEKIFAPTAELPGEIGDRLRVLREKLAAAGMTLSRRVLTDLYQYCAAVLPHMTCAPLEVLDWALSQRAMPVLLATANLNALHELNRMLPDMPRCLQLLTTTLPLPPI